MSYAASPEPPPAVTLRPQPPIRIDGTTVVVTQLPADVRLNLYAGDSFTVDLELLNPDTGEPLDLSSTTVRSQIRAVPGAPILDTLNPAVEGNRIRLNLTPEASAVLPANTRWDVDTTTDDGWVTTLAGGTLNLAAEITRPGDV